MSHTSVATVLASNGLGVIRESRGNGTRGCLDNYLLLRLTLILNWHSLSRIHLLWCILRLWQLLRSILWLLTANGHHWRGNTHKRLLIRISSFDGLHAASFLVRHCVCSY